MICSDQLNRINVSEDMQEEKQEKKKERKVPGGVLEILREKEEKI